MDYFFLGFCVLGFLAVVLFFEGSYLAWNSSRGPEAKKIQGRLQAMSAGAHRGGGDSTLVKRRLMSALPAMENWLQKLPRMHQLDRLLIESGTSLTVGRFLSYSLVLFLAGLLGAFLVEIPWLIALGLAFVLGVMPLLFVARARDKRLYSIEQQLPDALELMSRAMRAGHAFASAVDMVASEGAQPIASEFKIVFDETNYGVAMQDALLNLATRVPSTDLRYFVVAVMIQRETGGNLAELLDNLSSLMRARFKLMGHIRVLSAEGKLSAWILTLLPFSVAVMINIVNPGFMKVLYTDPAGLKIIYGMILLMTFGIFWMWRIIKIRV